MSDLTYDVRFWTTRTFTGKRGTRYQIRWAVGGRARYATFGTRKLAESDRAALMTAARQGVPFDSVSGRPASEAKGASAARRRSLPARV